MKITALLFCLVTPIVGFSSEAYRPSRLLRACEPFLAPPQARLWMASKGGRGVLVMTARPVATPLHLPAWMRETVRGARHFARPMSAIEDLDPGFVRDVVTRMRRGEDFRLRERMGDADYRRLENVLDGIGLPAGTAEATHPLLLSLTLLGHAASVAFENSEIQNSPQWLRRLLSLASVHNPEEDEVDLLSKEIDFKEALERMVRETGTISLDLGRASETRAIVARFETADFLRSLVKTEEDLAESKLKVDLFDRDEERLVDGIQRFLQLAPAVAELTKDAVVTHHRAIDQSIESYPRTLVFTEVLTARGGEGLLRRLRDSGYAVDSIESEADWQPHASAFTDRP